VFTGLFFGQISLMITVLMLLDALALVPRRLQGLACGIAASLKLTPLVLLPYLWVTGRRRAALLGLATFAATTAAAWLILPEASFRCWSTLGAVPDAVDVGQLDNQWTTSEASGPAARRTRLG
jgi:alpha-1,2-mannosyltransferase